MANSTHLPTLQPESLPKRLLHLFRQFRAWQRRPYRYKPVMVNAQYVCANCGDSFDGNFCPRCGQVGLTRRLTFKNAILSALDVWGMGGKSLPRNLLHLTLRPGYMMADYIRGHRQPYFPPFKMLFLLAAFFAITVHATRFFLPDNGTHRPTMTEINSVVQKSLDKQYVETPNNVNTQNGTADSLPDLDDDNQPPAARQADTTAADTSNGNTNTTDSSDDTLVRLMKATVKYIDDNPVAMALIITLLTSAMCTVQFRKSPNIPNMTFTEHFYAHLMIQSQMLLVSIPFFLLSLLWVPGGDESLKSWLIVALLYFDYRQLYGYGRRATLWRIFIQGASILLAIILLIFIMGIFYILENGLDTL